MSETTRNEKCTDCEHATSCSSAGFDLTCATGKWARKGARFVIVDTSAAGDALTFWRPNGCGYTTQLREAGLYTAEEVEQYQRVRGTDLGYPLEEVALHATGLVPVEALAKIHNAETIPAPQRTEETMPEEIDRLIEMFGLAMHHGRGEQATYNALRAAILRALRSPAPAESAPLRETAQQTLDAVTAWGARDGHRYEWPRDIDAALIALGNALGAPAPAESAAPTCTCDENHLCERCRVENHCCGEDGVYCDSDVHRLDATASPPPVAPGASVACSVEGCGYRWAQGDARGCVQHGPPPVAREAGEHAGPSLEEIAQKADAYAKHLGSVEGLRGALEIVAQNVRDALARESAKKE